MCELSSKMFCLRQLRHLQEDEVTKTYYDNHIHFKKVTYFFKYTINFRLINNLIEKSPLYNFCTNLDTPVLHTKGK